MLYNIRLVKEKNFDQHYEKELIVLRENELEALRKMDHVNSLANLIQFLIPIISTLIVLFLYRVIHGQNLTVVQTYYLLGFVPMLMWPLKDTLE